MGPDIWSSAAALLLLVAAVSSALHLAGRGGRWATAVALAGRAGSLITLGTALLLAARVEGTWSPLDLRQVALALALATPAAHLVLAWLAGAAGGSPLVDILAAAVVVAELLAIQPGSPTLSGVQRSVPYYAEWLLFLVGAGGVLVAGGAAGTLALAGRVWALAWPVEAGQRRSMGHGAFLAVVAVGAGIVVGVAWTWWATGTLTASDVRETWMAVVWLLAAMSLVAWQLERKALRWAAGLTMAAAAAVLLGLLTLPDLQRLAGV